MPSRGEEFADVVTGLWDCWDDDALVVDRATGTYIDAAKVHPLNHKGSYFSVEGPLNISRSPQGRPVIIQAGSSGPGMRLAARTADIVFTVTQDLAEAQVAYATFKSLLPQFKRAPTDVAILPGVMPIIGRDRAHARARLDALQAYLTETNSLGMLSQRLGQDMSSYDLDASVPDLPLPDTSHGFARSLLAKAKREDMTLRDLYNLTAAARGHWVLCGSPIDIADTLEECFTTYACDGFNILPPYFPASFSEFADQVVPILGIRKARQNDPLHPMPGLNT